MVRESSRQAQDREMGIRDRGAMSGGKLPEGNNNFGTGTGNKMKYKEYKDKIKEIFDKTRSIKCPAFDNEEINFNAKGVNHLLFKGDRSQRDSKRIETNIRLLPSAIYLLQKSTFWQEESRYEKDGKVYNYWAFEAVIDDRRIKVIIRQVGNSKKHFWSVIPAWRRDKFGVLNAKSKNLEK